MKKYQATVAKKNNSILGEGPLWHPIHKVLYWVDIHGKTLHALEPHTNLHRQWDIGNRVSAIIPTRNGTFILALQGEIVSFDQATGSIEKILDLEKDFTDHRCNDGKVDPHGRIWVGTMHLDGLPDHGSLYCIDSRFTVTRVLKKLTIPNGTGWSLDHSQMYFIDSEDRCVRSFDFSDSNTDLKNEQIILDFKNKIEVPDGMCVDSEGMLWIAFYGGQRVGRYNPFTSQQLAEVEVPAPNVTSCCFGGDDLDTLYITTAREGLNEKQLSNFPDSGSLFSCKVNVKGSAPNYFGLP